MAAAAPNNFFLLTTFGGDSDRVAAFPHFASPTRPVQSSCPLIKFPIAVNQLLHYYNFLFHLPPHSWT